MHTESQLSLTEAQRSRVEFAQQELDSARAADLADLSDSALIMQVERLRSRLDDVLALIREVHDHPSP
ncbi:hypothetical protein OHT52_20980 [Streptomyces sp. NBC_00247]|uniref:hypothetical protein n=1 Tax=Streptomyces sp. NBC_00247 TaxID=2975689 RepID=UPI002E29E19D|nr:hypothetical protein [Streptomyces sp. NBC_00247]